MKKRVITGAAIVVMLIVGLSIFASNPIISCKVDVPENYLEAIESQSKGTYSNVLPLVPIYVTVNRLEAETVYYTIHYFPFGSVGMLHSAATNGRWCGDQRSLCGVSGQDISKAFRRQW